MYWYPKNCMRENLFVVLDMSRIYLLKLLAFVVLHHPGSPLTFLAVCINKQILNPDLWS